MKDNLDAFLIIAFLIFVMLATPKGENGSFWNWNTATSTPVFSGKSNSYNTLSLGSGNAPYNYQSYQEYITLDNWGDPVNITGWQLKNGKDKRVYRVGSGLQRFSADIAYIPKVEGKDLVLGTNERAIITSGSVGVQSPYKIESFRENICTGYIEAHPDYAFEPSLDLACPNPKDEPGVENLERECRLFIERLSPCRSVIFNQKDQYGNRCENCVENNQILSESCATFIKEHFTYQGCLAYHRSDSSFYKRTWRIFLGRSWEMWAEDYESIELFDRFNNLITSINY